MPSIQFLGLIFSCGSPMNSRSASEMTEPPIGSPLTSGSVAFPCEGEPPRPAGPGGSVGDMTSAGGASGTDAIRRPTASLVFTKKNDPGYRPGLRRIGILLYQSLGPPPGIGYSARRGFIRFAMRLISINPLLA